MTLLQAPGPLCDPKPPIHDTKLLPCPVQALCSDLIPLPVIFVSPLLIALSLFFFAAEFVAFKKNNPKVGILEFYHMCGVRDGSAWARLDFPAESCPAGSPSCCSPAPHGCGSISCSLPSLPFQARGAGLALMGFLPPKQNEVLIFLLRKDSFCPVLGCVGRSRAGLVQPVGVVCLSCRGRADPSVHPGLTPAFCHLFLPVLLQGVPQEPAVPWFCSPIPLGHQGGFPGAPLAPGATATPERTVWGQCPRWGCLPSLAQLLMTMG